MALKSSFYKDLNKERQLSLFLDSYYDKHLNHYTFQRIYNKKEQLQGIDLKFVHKDSGKTYFIDEKAQLDYLNEDLPTFAFEISYQRNKVSKPGWLYDNSKLTDFYSLVTGMYTDPTDGFLFCKITLVNRKKLITYLEKKNVTQQYLIDCYASSKNQHGKLALDKLDDKSEGYLFHSKSNKAETPLNLILKLDWLIREGIAKRLA